MARLYRSFTVLFVLCIFITIDCFGQQFPIYTQYIFDPYLINPSLVATSRQSEVNLLYRQQWSGIQDGPKTIQFDFQHAFSNRVAVGINVFDDKTILLSSTSVMATFGYKVPLAAEHILSFGLSGGFFSNRIKIEDIPNIDINDPAILNSRANNFSFDGQFGLNYSFQNLNIGFSLIRLIDHKTISADPIQGIDFSELKNKIIFASYRFNLAEDFSLQPNFAYRFTSDNLNFFETSAVFSYKNFISVGGGYRESYGPTAIARVTIKDLQVGYAYDFPSTKASVSTGGTNEIQLKWRFGKVLEKLTKREKTLEEKKVEPIFVQTQSPITKDTIQAVEKPKEEIATDIAKEAEKPSEEITEPVIAVVIPEIKETDQTEEFELKKDDDSSNTFILVVGTFKNQINAQKLVKSLAKAGYQAEINKVPGSSYHYVHIPKFKTDQVSLDKILEVRSADIFKGAWYKKVQ
jgi:type IX secretion system PorP/SprF family membrane protein